MSKTGYKMYYFLQLSEKAKNDPMAIPFLANSFKKRTNGNLEEEVKNSKNKHT